MEIWIGDMRRGGIGEMVFSGYKVSVMQDEWILSAVWEVNQTALQTLKYVKKIDRIYTMLCMLTTYKHTKPTKEHKNILVGGGHI